MCFSYTGFTGFESNDGYEILLDKNTYDEENGEKLLACIIQSRHINGETFSLFIRFKINVNSVDGIVAYICCCLSGSRTCGTCSHVAAILYYLCYAKFLNEPLKKPGFMLNKFLKEDL